ncbi:MAG: hypothetical protein Q4G27_01855 [Flavobacteriaceae bacterium]|nr:hypothetical protein [Flavobacteriaceae bacterium]
MKKFIVLAAASMFIFTSCERKAETIQEEDTTSQKVLSNNETPSQYQGSTGVDEGNNNMVADENIALKKQDFKGSFQSVQTQTYTFTVLDAQDYSFSIESENPEIQYIVSHRNGEAIAKATRENQTLRLEPGEYTVVGTLPTGSTQMADPTTEFTVFIE